uniref:Uncharacterized protein n=1 Tax=Gadus morhua TaxID=8049 RepID=A0A8C5CKL4_GADMO
VVEPSGPVDGDVRLLLVQLHRPTPGGELAELKEPIKHRTLTSLHLFAKLDVVVAVVLGHLLAVGLEVATTHIDLHLPVQPVVEQEVVGHANPVGLHWMALCIYIIFTVIIIANFLLCSLRQRHFSPVLPAARSVSTGRSCCCAIDQSERTRELQLLCGPIRADWWR